MLDFNWRNLQSHIQVNVQPATATASPAASSVLAYVQPSSSLPAQTRPATGSGFAVVLIIAALIFVFGLAWEMR